MKMLAVAIVGLAVLTLGSPALALTPPQYILQWGSNGSDLGQMRGPNWMAFHAGTIYVSDQLNQRIDTFTTDGTPVSAFGDVEMVSPHGIAVAADGIVYVVDQWECLVLMYTDAGVHLGQFGGYGSGDGKLNNPYGVALDSSGNVYIADRENNRIQKFTATGSFLAKWGTFGGGDGQFSAPEDLVVTGGNVYVVDLGNSRIQEFTTDGDFIRKWGSYGSGDGFFDVPNGITADASSRIYVADTYNTRVQIFDASGTFLTKWGSPGSDDGQFSECVDVAVDDGGYVYVSDFADDRVQKFSPPAEESAVPPGVPSAPQLSFRAATWPNPSSGAVQLRFDLPAAGHMRADIYDMSGRLVRHLTDGASIAGESVFSWEGRAESGERVPSGIYLVRARLEEPDHTIRSLSERFVVTR